MRLAWFRAPRLAAPPGHDDIASVVAALASTHEIDVIDEACAHDFVWKQFRRPYDLCVYELDNTPAHQFVWPYLLHYPGLLWLGTLATHDSRAAALEREGRIDDYRAEFTFNHGVAPALLQEKTRSLGRGDWPMLRVPLLASKLVVTPHESVVTSLREQYPDARIRHVPTGVADAVGHGTDIEQPEIVLALEWPPSGGPLSEALVGMAAGKSVVVYETELTSHWPALNPQTWRPRGLDASPPVVVSIDPRDEEHSVRLARTRLEADAALRRQLGGAARAWWRTHATVAHAVQGWNAAIEEAAGVAAPPRAPDWPAHLTADGTELAKAILGRFGQTVDFLER